MYFNIVFPPIEEIIPKKTRKIKKNIPKFDIILIELLRSMFYG